MRHIVEGPCPIIRDESGLTLIELMIVLVLSLFLMAAVYMTFQVQKTTSDVQQEVSTLQQDVRAVLDIMAKDVRQAGCDPMMSGVPGLVATQCDPTGISFTMDLNDDGAVTGADEQVAYAYAGTSLTRNGIELSNRVTGFGLTYFDANGNVINAAANGTPYLDATDMGNVRTLRIDITMQSAKRDPDTNAFISRHMVRDLKMRNLGLF